MQVVMLTSELSKRFGDKKALEYIKNAGFDGFEPQKESTKSLNNVL